MLKKQFATNTKELKGRDSVLIINSIKQLNDAISFYNTYSAKIKGVQIKSSLLNKTSIQNSRINFISIIYDEEIKQVPQGIFVELIIPQEMYSPNMNLNGVNRIIVEYEKEKPEIITDLIGKRFFPFTKGIPFCYGNINIKYELFRQEIITNECPTCKLNKFCNRNGFKPKPISNPKDELIKFLENENTANRI